MAFDGSSSLYEDLLKCKEPSWKAHISGCRGLAGIFGRARKILSMADPPRETLVTAAIGAMDLGTRGSGVVPQIFSCWQDSLHASESPGRV